MPFVIAYNGSNHFAPTKPIRNAEVVELREANLYRAGLTMHYMLKRVVIDQLDDEKAQAWHSLYDTLSLNLGVFRPANEQLARGYEGPDFAYVPYVPPVRKETQEIMDAMGVTLPVATAPRSNPPAHPG